MADRDTILTGILLCSFASLSRNRVRTTEYDQVLGRYYKALLPPTCYDVLVLDQYDMEGREGGEASKATL